MSALMLPETSVEREQNGAFIVPGCVVVIRAGNASGACLACALAWVRRSWTDRFVEPDEFTSDVLSQLEAVVEADETSRAWTTLTEYELATGNVRREWIYPDPDCSECKSGPIPREVQLLGVDLLELQSSAIETPLFFRATRGQRVSGSDVDGAGAGTTADMADLRAHGEYQERSASWLPVSQMHFGTFNELDKSAAGSIVPETYALFSDWQYRTDGFPYAPFTRESRVAWVRGVNLDGSGPVWIPAQFCPFPYRPRIEGEQHLSEWTTTGISYGPDVDFAIDGSLCEVIERDALAISWLNRRTCRRIVNTPFDKHQPPGAEYRFYDFTSDIRVPVVAAVSIRDYPGVVFTMGAGSAYDPATALLKAANEGAMCIEFSTLARRFRKPVRSEAEITGFKEHAMFYAFGKDDVRAPLAFLLESELTVEYEDWLAEPWLRSREQVIEGLAAVSLSAVYTDLTPPWMRGTGSIVRVLVPGCQTMHPDHSRPFLGGRRLYDVPRRLGFEPFDLRKGWIPHALP